MSLRHCVGHNVQVWVWEDDDVAKGLRKFGKLLAKLQDEGKIENSFITVTTIWNEEDGRRELVAHID